MEIRQKTGIENVKPKFYFRYVDDILLTVPNSQIEDTLRRFNNFNGHINLMHDLKVDVCKTRGFDFIDGLVGKIFELQFEPAVYTLHTKETFYLILAGKFSNCQLWNLEKKYGFVNEESCRE